MLLRIRNLSISARLIGALTMLLVLLAVVVAVGLRAVARQSAANISLAECARSSLLAEHVRFRAADFNGWQTAYAFDVVRGVPGAIADTADARKAFLVSSELFLRDLEAVRDSGLTVPEISRTERIAKNFADFMALDQQIVAAYSTRKGDKIAKANELVAVDEIRIFQQISADVDGLVQSVGARAASAESAAKRDGVEAAATMIAAGLAAVAIGFLLAMILIRSIVRPLRALNDRLAEIADGDGDLTRRVEDAAKDELGRAASRFNRFADRMQELVASVSAGAAQVAEAAGQLGSVSTQLASGAEETRVQAKVVSAGAEEVSAIVTTLATSAEQMNASIVEISRSAARASSVSQSGVQAANEANQTVARLAVSSHEIKMVIKLITDIAAQTNLLALNATIEAARAGEVGKGFAVVAGEVKDLAQQTASATEEIARRVEAINDGSTAASAALARISAVVSEINDTQVTIASAIEEQTATTQEMTRNVGETASSAESIASNIVGVAGTAEQASAGAQATRATATHLIEAANGLNRLVSSFRF